MQQKKGNVEISNVEFLIATWSLVNDVIVTGSHPVQISLRWACNLASGY